MSSDTPNGPDRPAEVDRRAAGIQRRIFHLTAGSTFPTLYVFLDKELVLPVAVAAAVVAIVLEVARFRSERLNRVVMRWFGPLTKKAEGRAVFGSTWMLAATAICIAFIDRPFAILALYYLSLGDPAAALIGERFGSLRIGKKSLEGAAAFLGVAVAIGSVLLAGAVESTYPVMVIGAAAAALAELAPLGRVDDNFKVPLVAGGVMELAARWLG